MSFWKDLFGGSEVPYPLAPTGPISSPCGNGPFAPPENDGFFHKLFMPKLIPYPLRPCASPTPPVATVPPVVTRDTAPLPPATSTTGGTSTGGTASSGSGAGSASGDSSSSGDVRTHIVPGGITIGGAGSGSSGQQQTSAAMGAPSPVTVVISLPDAHGTRPSGEVATQQTQPVTSTVPASTTPPASSATSTIPTSTIPTSTVPASTVPASTPPASTVPVSTVQGSTVPASSGTTGSAEATASRPVALPMLATSARRTKRLHAFAFSPEFTAQYRTAHEQLLETMIDEVISARMITRDSTPIVFTVPEGCDAFDLLYGPVEVNPGFGCPGDLDQIVTVGEARVTANVSGINRPLAPGDQLIVTVPWRAASWVELEAGRLRCQIVAQFYKSGQPVDACATTARSAF